MQESEDSNEQFARYIVCAGHQGPAPYQRYQLVFRKLQGYLECFQSFANTDNMALWYNMYVFSLVTLGQLQ